MRPDGDIPIANSEVENMKLTFKMTVLRHTNFEESLGFATIKV